MKVFSGLLVLLGLVLVGCTAEEDASRVYFESNGGSEVDPVIIEENTTLSLPSDVSKDGYVFLRWYIDEALRIPFTPHSLLIHPVESDITVFAKWVESDQTVDNFDNWNDYVASLSDEDVYFVYLYSDTCPACRAIKDETMAFTYDNAEAITVIWLPVDEVLSVIEEDTLVPSMYVVSQNSVDSKHVGVTEVRALFSEVNDGDFSIE